MGDNNVNHETSTDPTILETRNGTTLYIYTFPAEAHDSSPHLT